MSEWHDLSSIDRAASDEKYLQAQRVLEKLIKLILNEIRFNIYIFLSAKFLGIISW